VLRNADEFVVFEYTGRIHTCFSMKNSAGPAYSVSGLMVKMSSVHWRWPSVFVVLFGYVFACVPKIYQLAKLG